MSSGPTNPDQVLPDDVTALILAAGEGSRLGQSKAFLAAYGKTLLERAVAAAQPFAAEMIVGVPAVDVAKSETLVGDSATVKAGGETRQETLETILALATRPLILLHEVARPMVPAEQFEQVLIAAAKFGAACPCIAASRRDPLAIAESGFIDEGLSRENVRTHPNSAGLPAPASYRHVADGARKQMASVVSDFTVRSSRLPRPRRFGRPKKH